MDGRQMIGGRFTFVFGMVPAITLDVEEAAEDGAWVRGEMIDRTASDNGLTATFAESDSDKPANTVVASLRAYSNISPGTHILNVTAWQSDNATVTTNGNFEVIPIQPTGLAAKQIIFLIGDGMGLGLSICYRIVQEYDGRISVRSERGKFCEFTLEFPAKA